MVGVVAYARQSSVQEVVPRKAVWGSTVIRLIRAVLKKKRTSDCIQRLMVDGRSHSVGVTSPIRPPIHLSIQSPSRIQKTQHETDIGERFPSVADSRTKVRGRARLRGRLYHPGTTVPRSNKDGDESSSLSPKQRLHFHRLAFSSVWYGGTRDSGWGSLVRRGQAVRV